MMKPVFAALAALTLLSCTFSNQAFDSLIPSLKFRRFDAAIAAMDVTEERAKQVDFSNIYYENSAVFVAAQGKFADAAQLTGKNIGVQNGTSHQSYLLEQLKGKEINKGNKALLDSLNQGLAAIKANGTYQKLYAKYFSK